MNGYFRKCLALLNGAIGLFILVLFALDGYRAGEVSLLTGLVMGIGPMLLTVITVALLSRVDLAEEWGRPEPV